MGISFGAPEYSEASHLYDIESSIRDAREEYLAWASEAYERFFEGRDE